MANVVEKNKINLPKKIHRYSPANEADMVNLLRDAGRLTTQLSLARKRVVMACHICRGSGSRSIKRKAILSHVNQAFNCKIEVYFAIA